MDTAKRKNRKLWLVITAALVLLIAALGAKPAWYAVQDLTFYWTQRSETELKVKAFAEEKGLFFAQYPKSLIALLESNPETEEFVLQYPLRQEKEPDLSGFDRKAGVPLFLQWDPQWGYGRYGSDYLAITGCGPTCLAMAGYYLTGSKNMNPADIAVFAEENGYYAKGYGSSWTLISEGSARLGLKARELPLVKKKMTDALEAGNPVILAMGTAALIIAEFTPVFRWLGLPFIFLYDLLQIPEAELASQTVIVGFADMFLPSVIASSSIMSEMTRFVVAATSVTQLIYMSEIGSIIMGSKIPVSPKDLFLIFLERTIVTLPVIALFAHLLF